jgi:hypothetical protein
MRNWQDNSTLGVLGCFLASLAFLLLAGWIALRLMEYASTGG